MTIEVENPLAIKPEQTGFTEEQKAALAANVPFSDRAKETDWECFFHYCQTTGLDPFTRQVYMLGRNSKTNQGGQGGWITKFSVQASIDGLRLIARRATDQRNGTLSYQGTLFCGTDGVWRDVWLDSAPPAAAKVIIERDGGTFDGVARFNDYAVTKFDQKTKEVTLQGVWATMPAVMIAKCAEALALRKAFPADMSGIYTADEMAQVDNPAQAHPIKPAGTQPPTAQPGSEPTLEPPEVVQQIHALAEQLGIDSKTLARTASWVLSNAMQTPPKGGWETWPADTLQPVVAYLRERLDTPSQGAEDDGE